MPKRKKEPTPREIADEILKAISHWEHIYEHGTQDPAYADGVNLNLTRDHVLYFKDELKKACKTHKIRPCLKEVKLKTPKVVDKDYCAKNSKAGPCKERMKKKT